MSTIDELIAEADELEAFAIEFRERATALKAKLRAYKSGLGKQAKVAYVSDGRLTEAGVRYCNAAFEQGRGPSEIARALGVTVPAIVMRRQRWSQLQKSASKSSASGQGRK